MTAQLELFTPDPQPTLTTCTCGPRAITPCGHCTHCDRCHDCGRCAGPGCTCQCEAEAPEFAGLPEEAP